MGLADADIGGLNLLEYDALIQRKKAADNRERMNAGIVAAAILNSAAFGDPDRKPVSPLDFVPDYQNIERGRADEMDLTTLTPLQQKAYLENMFSKRKMTKR